MAAAIAKKKITILNRCAWLQWLKSTKPNPVGDPTARKNVQDPLKHPIKTALLSRGEKAAIKRSNRQTPQVKRILRRDLLLKMLSFYSRLDRS